MNTTALHSLSLRLKRGQLSCGPAHLEKLQQLREHDGPLKVEIIASDLEQLPEVLCSLPNLKILNITLGALETWPTDFWSHPQIERLKIVASQGLSLPQQVTAPPLPQLKYLTLKGGGIEKLPPWFYQLHQLRELALPNNQLHELSENISELAQLTRLNLENNKLSQLPNQFYQLQNLNHLALTQNPLADSEKQKIYQRWNLFIE